MYIEVKISMKLKLNFFMISWWSYQLNCTANSVHLVHFCGKWAGLAVLFCRYIAPKRLPGFLFFQLLWVPIIHLNWIPLRPKPPHFFGHIKLYLGAVWDINNYVFELKIVYCARHLCKMRGESENYSSRFVSFQKAFKRCEATYENIKIRKSEFSLKIALVCSCWKV